MTSSQAAQAVTKPFAEVTIFSYQIVESTAKDQFTSGRAFRGFRFVTVKISLTYQDRLYEFYFNTGCTMSLIDRAFLNQLIKNGDLHIEVKKTSPIKVRELDTKEHNACEYTIILIYIPNCNDEKVALIRREIHIVDDLSAKALIEIDIIKSEAIILDTAKDMTTIESYNIQVSMLMIAKDSRTDAVIVSKARFVISAYSFLTVSIDSVDLSSERDLIFEPKQMNTLTLSASIVDNSLSSQDVIIRNDTDLPVTLVRHARLDKVLEYETEEYFQIDLKDAPLAERPLKKTKSKSLIKKAFKELMCVIAAFSAAISIKETVYFTDATVYEDTIATEAIIKVIEVFLNLWKDINNVINVSEDQWIEIPLVDNW